MNARSKVSFHSLVLLIVIMFIAFPSSPGVGASPAGVAQPANPSILAIAKELFSQFRNGHLDRSQFDVRTNRDLTDDKVRHASALLQPFSHPTKFLFLGAGKWQYAIGYSFLITFPNGEVSEFIDIDADGKIGGVTFRAFHKPVASPSPV